jgi:DNA-binding CsgD family transcriptional regulator
MAHLARGDIAAAREAIALGERASSGVPDHGRVLEARARLQLADGDPAGALASALALEEILRDRFARHQPRVWEWRRIGALAAHTLGEDARAQELLEPDVRTLREIGPARQLGEALTVEGLITGGEAGAELLAEAAGILERSPARLRLAETLLALGAARRRLGRRTDAKEPLYKALALAAEFGATPLEREAREELGRLGLRPRRTARSGVASLTPSEVQVAELAAEGMTTPQIAGRLHVTANTVETHLRHIYQKLSVSGRRELPSALERAVQTGS